MPKRFKVATWNAYHAVPVPSLKPVLAKLQAAGCTVVLGQEMPTAEHRRMFLEAGMEVVQHGQHLVAWSPGTWTPLDTGGGPISATRYARKGARPEIASAAAWALLGDHQGRLLDALSYHFPPHVQVRRPPRRRLLVTRESVAALVSRARNLPPCTAALYGGDDNVDEARAFRRRFRFMRDAATRPLRQIEAPRPTHGPRRIDDFRVARLRPLGRGSVLPAPGDHHVFVHLFAFAK